MTIPGLHVAFDSCAGIRYVIGQDKEYGRLVPAYDLKLYAERWRTILENL